METNKRLFDEKKTVEHTYTFRINALGSHYEPELRDLPDDNVHIVFRDRKFHSAKFPFSGTYTKAQWQILAAIYNKIEEIEKELNE